MSNHYLQLKIYTTNYDFMSSYNKQNETEATAAWDWSSRHVRLRYQMLAVCAAFTVLVVFDHRQISLLFLGDVVSGNELPGDNIKYIVICLLALLGSLYSVLTFYYRSETEMIEKKDITKEHDAALETLSSETNKLTKSITSLIDRKWAPIEPDAHLMQNKFESLQKLLPELDSMKSEYMEIRKLVYEYTQHVSSAEVGHFEQMIIESNAELDIPVGSDIDNHREYITQGRRAIDSLNKKLDDKLINSISHDLKPETIGILNRYAENFESDVLVASSMMNKSLIQMQGLTDKLVDIASILKNISDAANKTTKMHNRERITFGYKLPIWTATTIICVGVIWGGYRISQYCFTI